MQGKADNQWNRRKNDAKDGKTIENTDKPVFSPFYQLQMSPNCGVAWEILPSLIQTFMTIPTYSACLYF